MTMRLQTVKKLAARTSDQWVSSIRRATTTPELRWWLASIVFFDFFGRTVGVPPEPDALRRMMSAYVPMDDIAPLEAALTKIGYPAPVARERCRVKVMDQRPATQRARGAVQTTSGINTRSLWEQRLSAQRGASLC